MALLKLRDSFRSDIACHNNTLPNEFFHDFKGLRIPEGVTHTQFFRQPTFLSLPCNPPQNQHCRINCMKARTRFLFPIPFPLLLQYHVLPFSFHILEYFSKHTEDRKAAWNFKFSPDRQ